MFSAPLLTRGFLPLKIIFIFFLKALLPCFACRRLNNCRLKNLNFFSEWKNHKTHGGL